MNEAVTKTIKHPIWTIGTVISVILLFASGLSTANKLENQVNANTANDEKIEAIQSQDRKNVQRSLDNITTLLNQLITQAR